jgi:phage terminase Nu1 subunit (DNA packaging protein)
MKQNKTTKPVQPAPQSNSTLPLKEQLKQNTLDRYDLQELFNVSRNTIQNWCNAGILSFSKVGRKKYFNAEEMKQLLEVRKQVTVPGQGRKVKSKK